MLNVTAPSLKNHVCASVSSAAVGFEILPAGGKAVYGRVSAQGLSLMPLTAVQISRKTNAALLKAKV
jgi:hypothetical protein